MAKIRGIISKKRPSPSLESTARSPYKVEDGEEVMGPPHMIHNNNKKGKLLDGPNQSTPHTSLLGVIWIVCDVCGGEFKNRKALASHKKCHRLRGPVPLLSMPPPPPTPPSAMVARPNEPRPWPKACLELGLGLGNAGSCWNLIPRPPMPNGPSNDGLSFSEWLSQRTLVGEGHLFKQWMYQRAAAGDPMMALTNPKGKGGVNVACNSKPQSEEGFELKLGL